jgi:hypothetical protein
MVFVASAVVLLALFLAYVVDINGIVLARERGQQYGRLAALAAIEGYFSVECFQNDSECRTDRLARALERANAVSANNKIFNTTDSIEFSYTEEEGKGVLIPGEWIQIESSSECQGAPPCFKEALSFDDSINAFKVEGDFKTGFSGFFSGGSSSGYNLRMKTSAIATAVPRRGCFLVDISPSVTRDTHLQGAPDNNPNQCDNPPDPSEFAFFLPADNQGSGSISHQQKFNSLCEERPAFDLIGRYPTVHYQNDYVPLTPYADDNYDDLGDQMALHPNPDPNSGGDIRYSIGSQAVTYRIDAYRDSGYTGPEPLQTILSGIAGVINKFQDRAVAGDKACLIFFDSTLKWSRIIKPTSNYDYLLNLIDNESRFDIDQEGNLTLRDGAPLQRSVEHWIFPTLGSSTNAKLAVEEAVQLLAQDSENGVATADFLVMIGDGRTNCRRVNENWVCANNYSAHAESVIELQRYAGRLAELKIPLHMILIGQRSGPHTVDIAVPGSEPQRCYDDSELRALGIADGAVLGGIEGDPNPTEDELSQTFFSGEPLYQTSRDMYEIALATKGIWAPIRPLAASCGTSEQEPECSPGEKRRTDPRCRSILQQINDAMDTIMGQSPFTIVSVE